MIPAITSMKDAFSLQGMNAVITGGNRGLGFGIATAFAQSGANIAIVYPEEGTVLTPSTVGLIKNCNHPENGKLFIDFICSAEGQTALAAYQQGTLRYTNAGYIVPENAWLKPSSEIVWANRDVPYLTEHKAEILDKWNALWAKVTQ